MRGIGACAIDDEQPGSLRGANERNRGSEMILVVVKVEECASENQGEGRVAQPQTPQAIGI